MSEPKAQAKKTVEVVPGVHHWTVADDRMGGSRSDAYAVVDEDGTVTLIDPLPIDEKALLKLGNLEAIVLTAGNHQRSAWRMRKAFGVPVWAPEGAQGLEEKPDFEYVAGNTLPGGLNTFQTPGPTEAMYTLWMQKSPHAVVFISDLLTREGHGTPKFVPGEYQDEPLRTRSSIQRILDHLPIETVCFAHGAPIAKDGAAALRRALEQDDEFPSAPAPA
ncbi:MBL fold metallo-hydrolase [Corallococcus llansteffanensis]|uniref:MBL fold metallo-hydrolase n=1 Tax=Corallococcus llansteffanensis TaxID=2316731 RepID=A0A3A8Q054_9BACT|nr:MBL fold metallo-hydrolase [Corallococcus llansteffanensis]RKH56824.1 MBL fold metallo-hydrolase [Corallococcus llansteffanensis]